MEKYQWIKPENISRLLVIGLFLIVILIPLFCFAANEVYTQTDWSGGNSTTNATHPTNKTGWNKYSSQDANINTTQAGKVLLSPASTAITETSDTDFNAGVYSHTEVAGTGASAGVKLTATTQDPFSSNLNSWQVPQQLPSGVGSGGALVYTGTGDFIYATKGNFTKEFLKYSVSQKKWYHLSDLPKPAGPGADIVYYNGDIYYMQGNGWSGFYKYTIASGTWTTLASTSEAVNFAGKLVYAVWNSNPTIFASTGKGTSVFLAYNITTNQWANAPSLPAPANEGTCFVWTGGNYIYYSQYAFQGFYRLDLTTNVWVSMISTLGPCEEGATLAYDGGNYIYLARGNWSQNFDRYSISGNSWETLANTPAIVYMGGDIVYNANNSTIYAWGGGQANQWYPELWEYNPVTSKWSIVNYIPYYVEQGGDLCYDGSDYIYALGGYYGSSGVAARRFYRYSATANVWTQLADTPLDVATGGTLVYAGTYVYAFGGGSTVFWRYDPSGNTWSALASAPAAVGAGASLVYPGSGDLIYAVRGADNTNFWSYSISGNSWSSLAVTPGNVGPGAGLVYYSPGGGDYIYCLAGNYGSFWRYSVTGNTWSTLTVCPKNVWYGGGLSYPGSGDYVYAMAGGDDNPFLLRYSISGNSWDYLESWPAYRIFGNGGSLVYGGSNYLYATRGNDGREFCRYSITTGKWDPPAVVHPVAYKGAAMVKAGSYLYSLSGNYTKTFLRYSAALDKWEYLASLAKPVGEGGSLAYTGGDYIYAFIGGYQKNFYRYTISTDTWTELNPALNTISQGGSLAWTGGDYIFALRGESQDLYRYTISTGAWDTRAFTPAVVTYGSALLVWAGGNDVYCARGNGTNFWLYNTSTNMWTSKSSTPDGLEEGSAIVYPGTGDYIYCLQGDYNLGWSGFWRYSLSSNAWSRLSRTPVGINYGSAIVCSGNLIYIFPGNYYGGREVLQYSISDNLWSGASDSRFLSWGNMTPANGDIYVLQGNDSTPFYKYSPATDTWTTLSSIPANAHWGAALLYIKNSGYIYAFRGRGYADFYRYSITNNSWQALTSAPSGVTRGASLVYPGTGDYIYATRGGGNSDFWRYSISNNIWEARTAVPGLVESGGELVSDGADYLYTMRGYNGQEFYRYSISGNSWVSLADTPASVSDGGSLCYPGIGDYIYAVRGYSNSSQTYTTDFWRYSISANTWEQLTNALRGVDPGSSIVYPGGNYLYVKAGGSSYLFRYLLFASGTFTSQAKEAGKNGGFGTITWTDTADNKDSLITIKARSSNDSSMSSAPAWSAASTLTKGSDLSAYSSISDGNSYLQYQVTFKTTDFSKIPQISDLTFNYDYYPQKQELISSAYNTTTSGNRLMKLSWNKTLPVGTDVRFQLRTALDSSGSPGTWGSWLGPTGTTFIANDFSSSNDYSLSSLLKLQSGNTQLKQELVDFQYKQPITLDNTAGGVKTNIVVQVSLPVANDAFWAHVNSNGNDVRFFDGTQKLAYNLASFDYTKKSALINVKIPSISAGEVKIIYMLYGSANAISESDMSVLYIPTDGLLYWWKFDETSGTSTADSSTSANNGTLTNGPTWVTGKFGNAVNLDGSNDYVSVSNIPSTVQATIEAWIKPSGSNYTTSQSIIGGCASGGSDLSVRYLLQVANNALNYEWSVYVSDGRFSQIASSGLVYNASNFPAGVWTQLVVTYDGSNVKFYKNSLLVNTVAQTVSAAGDAQPFAIGRLGGYNGQYFSGAIDSAKIYNRALSASEVSALYQGNPGVTVTIQQNASVEEQITSTVLGANWPYRKTVKLNNPSASALTGYQVPVDISTAVYNNTGLVGSWHFSEGSGTTVADSSGNSNKGTISGATWTTSGKFGNGMSFDGVNDYLQIPNSASLQLKKNFTWELWFKANQLNAAQFLLARGMDMNRITITSSNKIDFTLNTNSWLRIGQITSNTLVNTGTWYHIVGVYDSAGVKLYVNGVLEGNVQGAAFGSDAGRWDESYNFGYESFTPTAYFNGIIDEARIYNRVLSAQEIQDHYNATKLRSDMADLRFIWINPSNGTEQLLSQWVESDSKAWVKVPSISAYSTQTMYLYYGNPSADSTSSFDNVFTKDYGESGLMGLWHMDEGTGPTVTDASGFNNTGTLTNGPVWQVSDGGQWGSRSDVRFSTGSALQFDGVDDYVDAGNATSLNMTAAFTIEAWVKRNNNSTWDAIACKSESDQTKNSNYFFEINPSGQVYLGIGDGINYRDFKTTDAIDDNWHHITAVFVSSTDIRVYVDNVLKSGTYSGTAVTLTANTKKLFIGAASASADFFNGTLDEVRIYNRALSTEEISRHYLRSKYVSPAVTAYFSSYNETANTYTLTGYYNNNPVIQPVFGAFYNNDLAEFQEIATKPAGTEIKYQVSPNGYRWYWWNGANWALVAGGYSEANTAGTINSNLATFMTQVSASGEFFYRAYLHSDTGTATPSLDQVKIATAAGTSTYIDSTGATAINILNNDAFNDQWFQYKAILYSSGKDTPILDDVTLEYINASIAITSPNTALTWQIGSAQNITWTALGLSAGDTVKISYSTDAGSNWNLIAANVTATNGTYPWTVPESQTAQARIKVASNALPAVYDTSDVNFTIGGIKIITPNSGETWEIGTAHNITWTSAGTVSNQLIIEYSKDNFAASPILIADQQANDGAYSWSVPNDVSNSVKIRIRDTVSPFAADTSDLNLRIQPVPQITVSVPNGGESWQVGTQHNITWAANAAVSNNLKIEYSKDDFASDINEVKNIQVTLPGWNYSLPVTINNSTNTNNLTDYQVKISIDSTLSSFWNHVKSDGSDIRFYDYNPTTVLPYYLGTFDYANKNAVIYVKLPLIPASSSKVINLCYGNPSAISLSNFDNVFPTGYSETGLVGLWHFSEGRGTTAADASGNNNNGALINGVNWTGTDKIGKTLNFDGVDDYVDCGNGASLNITGTNPITIEVWAKRSGLGSLNYPRMVHKERYISDSDRGGYSLGWNDDGSIVFGIINNNNTKYASALYNDYNTWHHIVGVYNGTIQKIYVDGIEKNSIDNNAGIGTHDVSWAPLEIGGTPVFNGSVDEARIYNRALSEEEIQAHYRRQKTTSPEPTVSFGTEKGNNVVATPTLPYYKVITINNSGAALTDYQFKITLDSSDTSFWSHVKSDGGDIRIYDDSAELAYWVESFNYAGKNASIWVKLPSVLASATKKIYLYYGNSSLTTLSNYDNVFTKDYGESGLAGLWHMDAGSGNTVVDTSGNANNGILNGSDGGRVGLSFDGSDDYVNCGNGASLNIIGAITIEAWIKSSIGYGYIVSKGNWQTVGSYGIMMRTENGNKRVKTYTNNNNNLDLDLPFAHNDNNWHHIVFVNTGGTSYLYWDGSFADSGNQVAPTANTRTVTINSNLTGYYLNGKIDGVRIYNRALSAAEVTEHYNGTYNDNTGLVGNWQMNDGGNSQTVADSSGNGNSGTRGATSAVEGTDPLWFNDPAWQAQDGGQWAGRSDVKFSTGSALSFDGVDDYVDAGSIASSASATMEVWIKPSGDYTGSGRTIMGGGAGATNLDARYSLSAKNSDWPGGQWGIVFSNGTVWQSEHSGQVYNAANFPAGVWTHLAATYDGSWIKFYKDGVLIRSVVQTISGAGNAQPYSIGRFGSYNGAYFSGAIDDVRIYNRALSAAEIQAQYQRRKYVSTVPAYSVGTEQSNAVSTSNFLYNKLVTIDNSGNANALADYQVKVTLNNSQEFFWSHVKSDGSDIRFFDGATELSYYIETFDYTNRNAVIWVKVPLVPASSSKNITVYYGSPSSVGVTNYSNTFTKDPEGTISTNGLVGNWLMNESSGTTTADSSGSANTGTLYGPARPMGLSFDGVDDYVDCGNGASLRLNGPGTFEAWIKTTDTRDVRTIVGERHSWSVGRNYVLGMRGGNLYFYHGDGDNSVVYNSSYFVADGFWKHVIFVADFPNGYFYVNGARVKTVTMSFPLTEGAGTHPEANGQTIGGLANWAENLNGSIDEVRIYNRALTAAEITSNYNGNVVRDTSLVMDQRMGEGSGTTLNDNSGNNNNGTISGATWVSSDRKLAKGHIDNYLEFDGKNDYVDAGNAASLQTAGFTYSAWVKPNDTGNIRTIIGWSGSGGANPQFRIESSNRIGLIKQNVADICYSTGAITVNAWNHVAVSYDSSGNYNFYINGVSSGSGTNLQTFGTGNNLFIGRQTNPVSEFFNGSIDEVRIYNRALSAQEISEQYEIGRGPVGIWNFDEGAGLSTADASGNNNTGTLVNGPVWQSDAKFNSGSALSFDGVDDYVNAGNSAILNSFSNEVSVSLWVYLRSNTNYSFLVRKETPGFDVMLLSNGGIQGDIFHYHDGTYWVYSFAGTTSPLPLNKWTHVCMTFKRNEKLYIYVDGVKSGEATAKDFPVGNGGSYLDFGMIGWMGSGNAYLNGSLDAIRIYNRALSAGEVQTLYQRRKYTSPEPTTSVEGDDTVNSSAYLWTIPDDVSSTVKVRITDNNRPTCTDKSDNNFSITQPTLTVTSPNGGEVWVNGDTRNITWTTSGQVSNTLKFEYSKDNFASDVHLIKSLWPYYQTITIDNSGNSKALYDYQAKVSFNSTAADFWSGVYPDGSDIRFYDGATELSYWIETFDYANKSAVLWVKVPLVPASSSKTITLKSGAGGGGSNFSNTFTKDPEGTISTSGLVGNWLMNESSGTTTADSSGTGNTGTLYNYPARPTGLSFDGVDDYVDCGNGASLNITSAITVEAWVYWISGVTSGMILQKDGNGYGVTTERNPQYGLLASTAGVRFGMGDGNLTAVHTVSCSLPATGWYHVVGRYDSVNNMQLYINGAYAGITSNPLASMQSSTEKLFIGIEYQRLGTGAPRWNYPFNNKIDEVRIYNRALTAGEITNNYNGQVVRDASLVMEQRMGEGSGTTLNDNSGNNNNGTINGATWVTSDRKLAKAHIGNYLDFDGKDDYVDAGNAASLNNIGDFSVTGWIKPTNDNISFQGIAFKATANTAGWGIYYTTGNKIGLWLSDGTPANYDGSNNMVPLNSWTYFAINRNGSDVNIYINGVLDKTFSSVKIHPASTLPLKIGWTASGWDKYFNGSIDDVKIYNRALSAAEISEQYEIGRGLVGAWNFDEASGTTVADSSGQGNTGTLVNGPTWDAADGGQWAGRADVKFSTGSALQFDGINDYVNCGNAASLNITNAITLEAWVYLKQDKWSYIISKGYGTDNALSLGYHETPKQWILHRYYGGIADNFYFGSQLLNQWVHITITGDLSLSTAKWKAYQNGILVGTNNWGNSVMSFSTNLDIGGKSGGRYFNGSIDEVRIYNRALTATEIQAHYQRRKPTSPEPTNSSLATESQDGIVGNSYPWVVPNDPSSTVKVRITDNTRPAVTDTSDNNFQILGYSSISLTSPNGGETLIMGDTHDITWTSYGAGVSNDLKLEYSTNNGTSWTLIADQQANDGTYAGWTVPNVETIQGLVRITDNTDALVTDTSDAAFNITIPTISITSPNGAETWYATGSYNITWTSVGSVSNNLKLEYTTNGSTWTQISTAETNDGSFAWTVPDVVSSTCKVRITDNNRTAVTDSSNANFSILAPTITLTSPNGAEQWVVGTAQDITWTSVGTNNSIKNNLSLQYSKDNFATNTSISTSQTNDGVFAWTIPDDVSTTVKVKIFDASRPATVDTSDANFIISQPYVRITAPNGGESWVIGTQHNITWASLGAISNNLKLEYSKDNFVTPVLISTGETNDGSYTWTAPEDVSSNVKVKLTDLNRPAANDASDSTFVVANPILTLTRPNGAELWTVSDTENITWTSIGTVSNNLKLDYSKDNFATAGIAIVTGLANSGTYPWMVPNDVSAAVRVRISDNARPAAWDKSNANFTVLPIPQITLLTPDGGETWRVGSVYTISWSDNGGLVSNNLTLGYSTDGGATWVNISTGEANDGAYSWAVPDDVSEDCKVRIYDGSRPANVDVSDLSFSIANPLINIISPNGGETFAVGDSVPVSWSTEGAVSNNLTLEYTTDGTVYNLIKSGQANSGSWTWVVPDFVSTSVKLGITDGNRVVVSDLSNANFTVIQYPTVTVTAPNGGEVYTIGDIVPVAWSYKGLSINPLTISYSRDNFATSSVIATGVAHTARSYNWAIPDNALAANTLKIKIHDPSRIVISDVSDAVFRIKGGFTITAPAANARLIAKKPETISWTTKGTVANVKLEYSLDSGTNWNLISSSVANTGSYTWTTVDNRTANYTVKVRVSDVTDPVIEAVSGLFKIDYYKISWRVLDYDTNAPLQLLSVKDTFWADQTNTITSPVDHDYPYGAYTTFWSKEGYIERAMEWTADSDKVITSTLENQITAAVEWHVLLSSSYSADTDVLKVSTWLERRGKLVGMTATDLTDLQSATVEVFDGTTALKSMTVNTHDSQGVFWFNWEQTGLTAGKTYFVRASITYRSSAYTSGSAVDVTAAKKQLEDKIQMQAIQTQVDTTRVAVDTRTAEIKTKLDDTKASVETKVAEVKGETAKILTAAEVALPAKVEEARAEVETTRKSEILNRENTVRTGQALNIRFRTYPGLSPVLDVYNKDNALKVDKAKMKEVGGTGIYEYEVKFLSGWGRGDFTIVCSEATKGTMDALIITVLNTDVEELSGQVSAVLGTTSGLKDVKSLADELTSQFNIIETSLAKVGADLAKEVKDAVSSVSALESIYTQLSNVAKEVKNISGEAGINLQKLYEISSDKKQDISYLKNKTQQLKAAMALNQKTVDNIANKPVTQTWYEYR